MNDWRKPCEHGKYDSHRYTTIFAQSLICLGGSPVTAADLEGLFAGINYRLEVGEWKGFRNPKTDEPAHGFAHHPCDCMKWDQTTIEDLVERLLIPIPDPQPATK